MIPKIIHWCWLSDDPIPETLQRYMQTWKNKLPGYDFVHWNFDKFHKGKSKWVDQAFDSKKYAFAADYIRLYALYHYGGIYLDMDVEVLSDFSPFLNNSIMLGYESSGGPEVAVFGVEKHNEWIKICLDRYEKMDFINADGSYKMTPLPSVIKNISEEVGYTFKNIDSPEDFIEAPKTICIYPQSFFGPKSYMSGRIHITKETVAIHHFSGSWLPWNERIEKKIWQFFGLKPHCLSGKVLNLLKRLWI